LSTKEKKEKKFTRASDIRRRVTQTGAALLASSTMPSITPALLKEAESSAQSNPAHAEQLYKQILTSTAGQLTPFSPTAELTLVFTLVWYSFDEIKCTTKWR
jgi:hypothetical protein